MPLLRFGCRSNLIKVILKEVREWLALMPLAKKRAELSKESDLVLTSFEYYTKLLQVVAFK
jgi:hypothetical protein